jgi:hypothetical protein
MAVSARRLASVALLAVAGCLGPPNQANVLLRKQNQSLQSQLDEVKRKNDGLLAQIAAAESSENITPQLPQSRLDKLYTVHGLDFGRLTGGYSPDLDGPDRMLQVYVVPIDDDGQPLKAAGSFRIEVFDLAEHQPRLGRWDFSLQQARGDWYGRAFLYTYILDCPWQTPPRHGKLMMRVTFTDELTGRVFMVNREVSVKI